MFEEGWLGYKSSVPGDNMSWALVVENIIRKIIII